MYNNMYAPVQTMTLDQPRASLPWCQPQPLPTQADAIKISLRRARVSTDGWARACPFQHQHAARVWPAGALEGEADAAPQGLQGARARHGGSPGDGARLPGLALRPAHRHAGQQRRAVRRGRLVPAGAQEAQRRRERGGPVRQRRRETHRDIHAGEDRVTRAAAWFSAGLW